MARTRIRRQITGAAPLRQLAESRREPEIVEHRWAEIVDDAPEIRYLQLKLPIASVPAVRQLVQLAFAPSRRKADPQPGERLQRLVVELPRPTRPFALSRRERRA